MEFTKRCIFHVVIVNHTAADGVCRGHCGRHFSVFKLAISVVNVLFFLGLKAVNGLAFFDRLPITLIILSIGVSRKGAQRATVGALVIIGTLPDGFIRG